MFTYFQSLECEEKQGVVLKPSSEWPSRGGIRFQNVTLCYRKGLPDVLKDVSFNTQPGERLGTA
jgi:ABC-type bacteriocin/lantibiotic exporter with double-glycine peptidase domain